MNSDEVKKSKINASLNHVLNSSAVRNINNVSPKIGLVQRIKKKLAVPASIYAKCLHW